MTSIVDALGEVLRKSISLKLWAYYLFIIIVGYIGYYIIQLLTLNLPLSIALGSIYSKLMLFSGQGGEPSLVEAMAIFELIMQNLPYIIAVYLVFFVIYFVISTLFQSIITGMELNIAKDFLTKATVSFESAWQKTKTRFLTLFKVNVLISILVFIFLLLLFLPAVFSVLALIESIPSLTDIQSLGDLSGLASGGGTLFAEKALFIFNYVIILIIVSALVFFLLSPFLVLIAPVTLFEKNRTIASIKRALFLGKENYLRNLAFIILMCIIIALVTIALIFIFALIFFLFSAIAATAAQAAALKIVVFLLVILLGIILFVPFVLWLVTFTNLAVVKLYLINLEKVEIKPAAVVEKKLPKKDEEQSWIKK